MGGIVAQAGQGPGGVTGWALQGRLLLMSRSKPAAGLMALAGLLVARGRRGGQRDPSAHNGDRPAPDPADDPEPDDPQAQGPVPGQPRVFLPVGGPTGTAEHGSAAAAGSDQSYELTAGRHVVGRSKQAHLRLSDTSVSLEHAEITVAPSGRTWVRDLGAENGVRVDGWPISTAELFDGDRLELGRIALLFHRDPDASEDASRDGFDRVDGA